MGIIPVKKTKSEVAAEKFVVGTFNHEIKDDMAASGIDKAHFEASNGVMNELINNIDDDQNFVSQLTEGLESKFSERELAFMCAKLSLHNMVEAFMAEGGNRANEQTPAPGARKSVIEKSK